MLSKLHILGPLWRLCTDFLYIARPGGTQSLQNSGVEFDPLALCRIGAGSQVGMASGCNPEDRGFDARLALHVVSPTQGPRIGTCYPAPG